MTMEQIKLVIRTAEALSKRGLGSAGDVFLRLIKEIAK